MVAAPRLKGYNFVELRGAGAFGQVWRARDLELGRSVAVKVLPVHRYSPRAVDMIRREAQLMASLPKHLNRVQPYQFVDGVTNCFLVMEFVAGGSLADRLVTGGPVPWDTAVGLLLGTIDGLAGTHREDLLHRDIKPANILLDTTDPAAEKPVLGDFGLAGQADRGWGGTPGYQSPEMISRGPVTFAADVYSLGATYCTLTTGTRPPPSPEDLLLTFASAPVPARVADVIRAALRRDPNGRPTLAVLAADLGRARWLELSAAVAGAVGPARQRVRLDVATRILPAPGRPVAGAGVSDPRRARPNDSVQVAVTGNADGHLTVLRDTAAGLVTDLPTTTNPNNVVAANHTQTLTYQVDHTGGDIRLLLLWTRRDVRKSDPEWTRWAAGQWGRNQPPGVRRRGAALIGLAAGGPPVGDAALRVVTVEVEP